MTGEFSIKEYLLAMEGRLNSRFDSMDEKLDKIPALETRIALVEKTTSTLTKGLWAVFISLVGAAFTYLIALLKGH